MGKYSPLERHLKNVSESTKEIVLTFKEIEDILGFSLCRAAHSYRAWWGNQGNNENRPQAQAWMNAGWYVSTVDQRNGWVSFTRTHVREEGARGRKTSRFSGETSSHYDYKERRTKDETYYASLLGLSGRYEIPDIKAAYEKQILQYHPDRVQHNREFMEIAERKMKSINEAYEYFQKKYDFK